METLGQLFAKNSKYTELINLLINSSIKKDFINYGLINEIFDDLVINNIIEEVLSIIRNNNIKQINIDDYSIEKIILMININPKIFMKNENEFHDLITEKLSNVRNKERYKLFFSILEKLNINIDYVENKKVKEYKSNNNFMSTYEYPIYNFLNFYDLFQEMDYFVKNLCNQSISSISEFINNKKFNKFTAAIQICKLQFDEILNNKQVYYGLISKEFDDLLSYPSILEKHINIDEISDEEFIICFSNIWYLNLLAYYKRLETRNEEFLETYDYVEDDELCEKILKRAEIVDKKYELFLEVFNILKDLPLTSFKNTLDDYNVPFDFKEFLPKNPTYQNIPFVPSCSLSDLPLCLLSGVLPGSPSNVLPKYS